MEFTNRVSFGGILVKDYIWYVVLQSERFCHHIMLWSISIIQQQFKVLMADLLTKGNCWHKNKTVYVRWKLIWPTNHQRLFQKYEFFPKTAHLWKYLFLVIFLCHKAFLHFHFRFFSENSSQYIFIASYQTCCLAPKIA